jgi:hypothetical protein
LEIALPTTSSSWYRSSKSKCINNLRVNYTNQPTTLRMSIPRNRTLYPLFGSSLIAAYR